MHVGHHIVEKLNEIIMIKLNDIFEYCLVGDLCKIFRMKLSNILKYFRVTSISIYELHGLVKPPIY